MFNYCRLKRPGGVYITLLKQSITEEQMKSIFRRDRQLDNQSKKKRKRMKAKQDKAKVEQMKKRMDKELEKMEQKRWNEEKQQLPDVKLEKRYGIADVNYDHDIDLMEVDDIEYDEDSMAVTNGNDHENEEIGNHDNEVNGNHDDIVEDNHGDNELLSGEIIE